MKRILLVIFALISLNAFSQLQVKEGSFKYVPGGVIEDKEEYTDGNDLPMALIKISTENINEQERLRLIFTGNRATQIIKKPKTGEMWVYISADAATFINIKHPDYGTYKYLLPEKLCDYCVYEMVLQYVGMQNVSEQNYLIVKSDQANAKIYIDGEYIGNQYAHKQLLVGSTHTWKIECDLYRTESDSITITNKENVIDITLLPEFGYLNVTTSPESGAKVYINDNMVGTTPYKSDKLSIGNYTIKVVKDKFKTTEQNVVVKDKETSNANIEMLSVFVDVTVKSDSNSDVLINGAFKGKGNWTGKLQEGMYVFEARKENHRTTQKTVEIVAGNNQTIKLDSPEAINGSLEISSNPSSADIYIDEKHCGKTPNYIESIIIGTHKLKLEKEGCASITKNIVIEENQTLEIKEQLPTGKEVVIKTDQSGDKIYVDGNYVGTTPLTTNLGYGKHDIKATRGTQTAVKTVEVKTTTVRDEFVLAFGKMVKITSDKIGDDIYVDGKKVGTTPMDIDFSLGKHDVEVRRGKLYETGTIDTNKDKLSSYYFVPKKEPLEKYLSRGVNFITLNAAYSVAPQTSFGFTYGQVKRFGWFVSAMSSFDFRFRGNDWNDLYSTDGVVDFSGKSSKARLSVTGGFVVRLFGPIYAKLGAGYGARVKCWEVAGKWYEYTPDTYKGFDLTAGIMLNTRKYAISADVVTNNFKTMEVKLGVGLNWNK